MYKHTFYLLIFIFLTACSDSDTASSATGSTFKIPADYTVIQENDELQRVLKKKGKYVEVDGYLKEGIKDGFWIYYYPNRNKVERIEHFINGKLWGPVREFGINGRLKLEAYYTNGKLDGTYKSYNQGTPIEEAFYKNGNLDGKRIVYFNDHNLSGKIQQEMTYKNGVLHGSFKYYNADGEVSIEYNYVNGEKQ